jgi:UDP-4-amino-4,6-dideoxy-N-acetyl-beta-L-altrosamine transaminase
MAFIPYSRQEVSDADIAAVVKILRSEYLTQGPAVGAFEAAFAARHEVSHAIAVSNATAGLHIACLALGVNSQSRVWTSSMSFLASANCARYCGASVDFVDIDPLTRNMSIDALQNKLIAAERTGTLPSVVIPVDFSGLPCDLIEIRRLADKYHFKILEDASHATGSSYLGRPTGSQFSDVTVFSFHAVKIVTTAEGGIVTTKDLVLAEKLRSLRSHGMTRAAETFERQSDGPWYYEQRDLGFNYRLTDMQAALGHSQLARLDDMHSRREALADNYDQILAGLPLLLPARRHDRRSAWHLYAVEVDGGATSRTRREIFEHMRSVGIGVNVHYIPIHTQPYYSRLGFTRGSLPHTELYYSRALSIPLFPAMTMEQQSFVAKSLSEAIG